MKKILGIMGSPHKKGNTFSLISQILTGAQSKNLQTELILLKDKGIAECDGCHVCWKGLECPKNDDMNGFYPKIIESDILIFGTPVYWYGPTVMIKAFLDRFVYFNCPENRNKLEKKKVVLVIPFEEESLSTAGPLVEMFEKSFQYLQIPIVAKLLAPEISGKNDVEKNQELLSKAFELGCNLLYQ